MPWECPRCRTIHADYISQCSCPPQFATFASNNIKIDTDPQSAGYYKCNGCGHLVSIGMTCMFCKDTQQKYEEINKIKDLEERIDKLNETCRNLNNRISPLESADIERLANQLSNTRIIELDGLNVLAFPMSNITGGNIVIRGKCVISGITYCKDLSEEYLHKSTQMTIYKRDAETDKTMKMVLLGVRISSYDKNDSGYAASIVASGFIDWTPCDFVEDVERGSICSESPCVTKDENHNLLQQLDCLRESAQRLCMSLEKDIPVALNNTTWKALRDLAMYCGYTNASWWHENLGEEYTPQDTEEGNQFSTYD